MAEFEIFIEPSEAKDFERNYWEAIRAVLANLFQPYLERNFSSPETENNEQSLSPHRPPDIQVFDGELLVFDSPNQVAALTKDDVKQIWLAAQLPPGQTGNQIDNFRVEIDRQEVFRVDSGKVTKNLNYLPQQSTQESTQQSKSAPSPEVTVNTSNDTNGSSNNSDAQSNSSTPEIGALSSIERAVSTIEDPALANFLVDSIREMKRLAAQNQQLSKQVADLIVSRVNSPRSPSWWQTTTLPLDVLEARYQQNIAAQNFLDLFHHFTEPGQRTLLTEGYTIERIGRSYTVKDAHDNQIMKFRSLPFGVHIEGETKISLAQQQELHSFRSALAQERLLPPNLTPKHIHEAKNLGRSTAVASQLVEFARTEGRELEVQGNHYQWKASLTGDVWITRLRDKEIIFQKENGLVKSGMNSKDIEFFEQVFAAYQQQKQQNLAQKQSVPSSNLRHSAASERSSTRSNQRQKSQMEL